MAISVGKLAPSAVVVACVGYCVWPSLSDILYPPQPRQSAQQVRDIPAALFSPTLSPPPESSPWGGLDAAALAASKTSEKEVDTSSEEVADAAIAQAPTEPTDTLAGLKLDATSILGDDRVAVINGQMCAAQEKVSFDNKPYRVVRILPYKVVLENNGRIMDLTYSGSHGSTEPPVAEEHKAKSTSGSAKSAPKKNASSIPHASAANKPAVPDSDSFLGSLIKKQTAAWESVVNKQEAAEAAVMSGVLPPTNKGGN